ncbi:MAG: pyridoxal 5'-phosphate synthase glutaminase subunit PdxT [Candidatus Diapherotrites archaeon]|uniref:Pyridoxal 5'-phosphate synthase subunit PdxT n=1 Tax=Candidatus Iainarchaeum sp. TaxID=3101447 RepID=A0A7J4IUW1_9ARCH|nr:pyridoxal 5'-phosphate synthase glutaminase subunit PdxT [Candidatus Diapherotrites archaeon]HIH08015.1 pyridoxal 5'-phosphate synthase glutaminase subunit PdxT [Candidatus Diapherotrites archaeon]
MRVGVLALQGDFREHRRQIEALGVECVEVRNPEELEGLAGLIIPGGESTTISNLMKKCGLDKAIKRKHKAGMALMGTCAGAILLSKTVLNEKRFFPLGLIDVTISRNSYGRQVDSFEADLNVKGLGKVNGAFIRAPVIEGTGNNVEVLSSFNGKPVLVMQGKILLATFHTELGADTSIHRLFCSVASDGF